MKHELSTTWKKILISALAVLAVAVLGIGTFVIIQVERSRPRQACDEVYYENEDIRIIAHWRNFDRPSFTMQDKKTGEKLIKRFRWFSRPEASADSIRVICDWDYQRGYFNIFTGKIVITPQYSHAWNFSEGLAAVAKDNRVGFINPKGEEVIPCQFAAGEHSIQRLGFAFHDSLCVMTNERDQCGIINRKGEWVVEPQYDCIWHANEDGLRIFQNDGLYGLMDKQGNIVVPLKYDQLIDYGDFYEAEENGIRYTMDHHLNVLQPFLCDWIEDVTIPSADGEYEYSTEYTKYHIGYKEGIIDGDGKVIIRANYYQIRIINDNLFKANIPNTQSWILFDGEGNNIPITIPE